MRHLWHVLKGFFDNISEEKVGPLCNIYSAQAYCDVWRFQELAWQSGNDPKARFDSLASISPFLFTLIELTALSTLKQTPKIYQT